jgi:DNA repair protein RecN (Recombination protein N)
MLQSLRIRNLAVVDNVEVAFGPGLNVITGETGAGKSIVVGALGLVLGERGDKSAIRTGEEQCSVEAVFELPDSSETDSLLESLGLPPCEDGSLIVRRALSASGSGKSWINDAPATAQALKRLGDLLVDMHGPHDHQSLLNRDYQLDILDAYGHLWKLRASSEEVFTRLRDARRQRAELEGDDEQVAQQIDLLSYQVKEMEDAQLSSDDGPALENEHRRIANAHEILALADGVRQALTDGDGSAFNAMTSAVRCLAQLEKLDGQANEWLKEAESVSVQIRELESALARYSGTIDADPGRMQWLEDRMALVHRLKRKYGASVDEILASLDKARERLQALRSRGERIAEIEKLMAAIKSEFEREAGKLTAARSKAAAALARAITSQLRELGFGHGSFAVDIVPAEPAPSGMDSIEFGFAPNAGEAMRPLRAIASSGEISRVMLATKAVLAVHDRIPLLVFDEIDANIGGEMGNAIGAKLMSVAGHHQILCITHLPQVAVCGDRHYVVEKSVSGGRTRTTVRQADGEERVEEIARMLGGRESTSVVLDHAREMLGRNRRS